MRETERLLRRDDTTAGSSGSGEEEETRGGGKRKKVAAFFATLIVVVAGSVAVVVSSKTTTTNRSRFGMGAIENERTNAMKKTWEETSKKRGGTSFVPSETTTTTPSKNNARLGYANDVDMSALGAKEGNMIRASLAIEEVQRKIKRLEKAKRQRALNIQDEDEYLEDEVAPLPDEEDAKEEETTAKEEEEETEEKEEENEQMNEQDAEDERNAAVRLLIGEDPVEQVEEKQKDENKEKTLPQVLSTSVNQKLEEELKEEEKNNASESDESVEEKKNSMKEMALAFQKEMERAALEDELTATPEEREEQELEATETSAAEEEAATKATPDEENEEVSPVELGTGNQEQETIIPSETIALLQGSTKRDLSDEEFYKLEKLLKYNAKKRGVSVKSVDATPAQRAKAELCPSSAIYAGKCECSSCALVLPMPDMVGMSLGTEIDSHKCVARMNAQYIEVQNSSSSNKLANPRDYGSKTDFVFSNVVEHTLKDLIENLNTTKGKKLNAEVKHKFLHVPFWRPSSEVFDFLEAHNDWKTIPHAVTKETTDLFAQMKGAEGKQWSSGFLAYVMLSRHYCAKTTVYSYWRAEEDPSSQTYVTNSKGGARKMWSGHSFGGEHEFIKNAAESHDFGTRVRYLDALKEGANKGEEVGGIKS